MLASHQQVRTASPVVFLSERRFPEKFSWRNELRELFSVKLLNIIWWPLFRYRQRYFTRGPIFKQCKQLPVFSNLWNTIQKGSFAYNCLFLGIKPYHRSSSLTDLADVTTLALFFGDEFIDGISKATGKEKIRNILAQHPNCFNLNKHVSHNKVQLQYSYHPDQLFPAETMNCTTLKYNMAYSEFFQVLQQFLEMMNACLEEFSLTKAHQAADKIIDVCTTCLKSYLHDVNTEIADDQVPQVADVLHFHELKTMYMQEKLLELRCILAGKEFMMKTQQVQGWLNIMRVVQICDDLQDVLEDVGFQDNLVISAAVHNFSGEWNWLRDNFEKLQQETQLNFVLSLHMPQTIHYCLNLASTLIKAMNWEQKKIIHHLLFKNWFIARDGFPLSDSNPLDAIFQSLRSSMPSASDQVIKTHFINTCFHSKWGKSLLRKKLSYGAYYRLRYDLLSVSYLEKSKAFDKCIKVS